MERIMASNALAQTGVEQERALPFNPLVPNEETIAAMKEARQGGLPSFSTVKSLMDNLKAED